MDVKSSRQVLLHALSLHPDLRRTDGPYCNLSLHSLPLPIDTCFPSTPIYYLPTTSTDTLCYPLFSLNAPPTEPRHDRLTDLTDSELSALFFFCTRTCTLLHPPHTLLTSVCLRPRLRSSRPSLRSTSIMRSLLFRDTFASVPYVYFVEAGTKDRPFSDRCSRSLYIKIVIRSYVTMYEPDRIKLAIRM